MKTFEEYLKDVHAVDYRGTDDDMPESFENWLSQLDGEEWLKWGGAYGSYMFELGIKRV